MTTTEAEEFILSIIDITSDETYQYWISQLIQFHPTLLYNDTIRETFFYKYKDHQIRDIRKIIMTCPEIDISRCELHYDEIKLDDIDFLIDMKYDLSKINESMYMLFWFCLHKHDPSKVLEILAKLFEYFALTKTYDEIICIINKDMDILKIDDAGPHYAYCTKNDIFMLEYIKYVDKILCIDILSLPKFHAVIPFIFKDRLQKTICYLIEKGLSDTHLQDPSIANLSNTSLPKYIKSKLESNGISGDLIEKLQYLYIKE